MENTVEPSRPQMTIWRMRIACWLPKTTNTYSEYVILIACPLQQWLCQRASMLLYTYIDSPVYVALKKTFDIAATFSADQSLFIQRYNSVLQFLSQKIHVFLSHIFHSVDTIATDVFSRFSTLSVPGLCRCMCDNAMLMLHDVNYTFYYLVHIRPYQSARKVMEGVKKGIRF